MVTSLQRRLAIMCVVCVACVVGVAYVAVASNHNLPQVRYPGTFEISGEVVRVVSYSSDAASVIWIDGGVGAYVVLCYGKVKELCDFLPTGIDVIVKGYFYFGRNTTAAPLEGYEGQWQDLLASDIIRLQN